jgi:CheY-like chemotaxis protein
MVDPNSEFAMRADAAPSPELRVLVVDDNVDGATTLAYLLQLLGCKTAVAFDGANAVRVAQVFQPHLLIIDLVMRGGNGCQALASIRQAGAFAPGAYFVCLTALDDPRTRAMCADAGCDRLCAKPIDAPEMSEILAVGRQRASLSLKAAQAPSANPK